MIRYAVTRQQLERLIEEQSRGWLQKAAERTEKFRQSGRYTEKSSIWSKVKPVYMRLQGDSKCAYCERKLESIDFGKGEQDVEHFRPKKGLRTWKKALKTPGIVFTNIPGENEGYHLLPYHPFNYAAACNPCNRVRKRDYFPIAGAYDLTSEDPEDLLINEQPYLIYPLGNFDEDPESIIDFHGISPRAVADSGHRRHRGLVTIEFFKLDDVNKRKNLVRERALIIVALFPQLQKASTSEQPTEKTQATQAVANFTSSKAPHANCARSFKRLFESNPTEAEAVYENALEFVTSVS
jgi:hypothetical protein